ncbi:MULTISPECIES: TraR/DksA C4-type zinc finger protein [unclassified Streptomyces]|uniref:TraR/DksA family transcriptional regulator n=1 Tax=unclassified Streptomyces TaxID=2593676 RepID=UPI002E813536|nr:TraR/DksA C4-type zinc finger protein [Streptomyces sp. NBC_00562]WTC82436.1 TraR/DksA C4-type zinc finger protein [Streptomyces sp. NBC_01653]WTD88430.1 TraR/DksA C4-type zinc finger protein [Streptomyces sp. NBC_01637]WUC19461.1 TraR/DksA C4-type zinc finger protein [Streptomyces sp. NBC_00562]
MVAKKTAEQKSASARSTGAAAEATTEEAGSQTADPGPRKAAAKSTATKKAAAKKAVAKKAPAKKAAAKKSAVKKASKKTAAADTGAAEAAEETGAHTVVAKKSAARTRTAGKGAAPVPPARAAATAPGELAVRPGEDPWTPDEVSEARAELTSEIMRLRSELEASGVALAGLMRDSGNGAGDDEADTGTKNITREHEMALAANATEMLEQTERALARLDAGTYGLCEICGKPIGKARMQAFPRATLCVEDKQKQERRG